MGALRYGIAVAKRPPQDDDAFDADDDWREGGDLPDDEPDESEFAADDDEQTAYCPECGAEIHDSADICTKCFTWIDGATRRPPGAERARARRNALIAWLLIGSILAGTGLLLLLARF